MLVTLFATIVAQEKMETGKRTHNEAFPEEENKSRKRQKNEQSQEDPQESTKAEEKISFRKEITELRCNDISILLMQKTKIHLKELIENFKEEDYKKEKKAEKNDFLLVDKNLINIEFLLKNWVDLANHNEKIRCETLFKRLSQLVIIIFNSTTFIIKSIKLLFSCVNKEENICLHIPRYFNALLLYKAMCFGTIPLMESNESDKILFLQNINNYIKKYSISSPFASECKKESLSLQKEIYFNKNDLLLLEKLINYEMIDYKIVSYEYSLSLGFIYYLHSNYGDFDENLMNFLGYAFVRHTITDYVDPEKFNKKIKGKTNQICEINEEDNSEMNDNLKIEEKLKDLPSLDFDEMDLFYW